MERTAPTRTATLTPAAVAPDDRPEVHNISVDDQLAETGACIQIHLPCRLACAKVSHAVRGSSFERKRPRSSEDV